MPAKPAGGPSIHWGWGVWFDHGEFLPPVLTPMAASLGVTEDGWAGSDRHRAGRAGHQLLITPATKSIDRRWY